MSEQEKKPIDPKKLIPGKENQDNPETEKGPASFLDRIIGSEAFIFDEDVLDGEEKTQGVTVDTSPQTGAQKLIFDKETVNGRERALIQRFISLVEEGGRDALLRPENAKDFGWFFGDEDNTFLDELAALLKRRLTEIDDNRGRTTLKSMGFDKKLVSALEAFREMSYRSALKEGINKQVSKVPITGFQAKMRGSDQPVNLRYNPNNINDPSNEVEVIYVSSPSGEKELVFSCKDPNKYESIRPVMSTQDESKFAIVAGSAQPVSDVDSATGRDFSYFEMRVQKREGQPDPLFTKIKVLRKPINLDVELDKYIEEKRLAEEKKRLEEERKRQQAAAYSPTPPSVPSTSQYKWTQQPQTYSRSG